MIRIGKLLPSITNSQGDAENADAIVTALNWMSRPATLVSFHSRAVLTNCDAYVLGHVTESDFDEASAQVQKWSAGLREQVRSGSALLAVGSGLELLTSAGLLGGVVGRRASRSVGDCVVDSGTSQLWGFENSASSYVPSDQEQTLGRVLSGAGNGDGFEGVRVAFGDGLVLGTHLHGPVLVRNEELMDEVLTVLTGSPEIRLTSQDGIIARELARQNRAEVVAKVLKAKRT